MPTARELFDKSTHMQFGTSIAATDDRGEVLEVQAEVVCDFEGGSKYLKLYIPEAAAAPDALLAAILNNADEVIWQREASVGSAMALAGTSEKILKSDLRFSGRVLVYTPSVIENARWENLGNQMAAKGMSLLVRDGEYAKVRSKHETPLAFISHDSRDKPEFVRELASQLSSMLCPVWYDEYKLVPGQGLRESIEAGLKLCKKCVVVLSRNFFSNPGWTKREFDSIYTREILEGQRVMIPIWLGVTKQEVYEYSPTLVDTFGIDASVGVDEVARKLMLALNYEPPLKP